MMEDEKYRRMENSFQKRKKMPYHGKPRVLILPDIAGWVMETFADNIIRVLSDQFEFTKVIAEDMPKDDYKKFLISVDDNYEIIYPLLPGYIPEYMDTKKFITSFHGGPGVEGQADQIDRNAMNDMNISFVSHQVKDRVTTVESKTNRRIRAPLKYVFDEKKMLKEQKLDNDSVIKYRMNPEYEFYRNPTTDERAGANVHIWRKGFGLTNLHFTPYGINPEEYKRTQAVSQKELICGYAGWMKYIMGGQANHRRIDWIISAQRDFQFKLEFAAGLSKYVNDEVNNYKKGLKFNHEHNINVNCYNKDQMSDFYSKINCYLVPDKFAGGPMPVLEAGLLEVPPVCTDAGLCGDIITHMENGYVVNTKARFMEGVKFMRDNPDERIRMGKNLRKYILEHRTWENVKPPWQKFLSSALITDPI
jgi:glycosyltransferase involved in cell wall biosynthesis